jgi:hypothetical protein
MSHPFEPPVLERGPVVKPWLLVVGAWSLAGACVGTAVGATLQITLGWRASAELGLAGMLLFGALGFLALTVERGWSVRRPELVDVRGWRSRPVHGVLLGIPVVLAVPALCWLVVVGSIAAASLTPAFVFGTAALIALWAGRRVWSSHRLARALEGLEEGPRDRGIAALRALADDPWVVAGSRTAARLNLAQLALTDGDADGALRWAEHVSHGSAGAMAAVVRALAHLLRGDPLDEVEDWLGHGLVTRHAGSVQPEADAVRVLLVWRRDGREQARELADRLYGPASSALHGALLLASRGEGVPGGPEIEALKACGLGRAIPELWR